LISLVHRFNPDIDIQVALDSMIEDAEAKPTVSMERPEGLESDSESAPSLDRFEWSESSTMSPSRVQKDAPDGMALLPTRRTESGYLGEIVEAS
jgi:hypothetical protein